MQGKEQGLASPKMMPKVMDLETIEMLFSITAYC